VTIGEIDVRLEGNILYLNLSAYASDLEDGYTIDLTPIADQLGGNPDAFGQIVLTVRDLSSTCTTTTTTASGWAIIANIDENPCSQAVAAFLSLLVPLLY
jgi:hypothetical protein